MQMPVSSMAVKHTAIVTLASLFVLGANTATAIEYDKPFVLGANTATKVEHANSRYANTVRAGYVVSPEGAVSTVEYEHLLVRWVSLGARLGYIDYDFKNGSYRETGNGSGAEFLVRVYPQGRGYRGFYIGGGFGLWDIRWAWTDPTSTPTSGSDQPAQKNNINLSLGWRIPLGNDRVYIDPSLVIGSYFTPAIGGPNTRRSGLGPYVAAGLSVGVNF